MCLKYIIIYQGVCVVLSATRERKLTPVNISQFSQSVLQSSTSVQDWANSPLTNLSSSTHPPLIFIIILHSSLSSSFTHLYPHILNSALSSYPPLIYIIILHLSSFSSSSSTHPYSQILYSSSASNTLLIFILISSTHLYSQILHSSLYSYPPLIFILKSSTHLYPQVPLIFILKSSTHL